MMRCRWTIANGHAGGRRLGRRSYASCCRDFGRAGATEAEIRNYLRWVVTERMGFEHGSSEDEKAAREVVSWYTQASSRWKHGTHNQEAVNATRVRPSTTPAWASTR